MKGIGADVPTSAVWREVGLGVLRSFDDRLHARRSVPLL